MIRRSLLCGLAAFLLAVSPATSQQAETESLSISGAFARASPKVAQAGAGFMTIRSNGPADRLLGFRSPACKRPELHTHVNDNGMMRMRQVEAIEIPAGGEAVLKPGDLHLMFIDLTAPLVKGETIEALLIFENAGDVALELPVKGPGAMK